VIRRIRRATKNTPQGDELDTLEKITADLYSLAVIKSLIGEEFGKAYGNYNEVIVTSHFQPIFNPSYAKAIGYEALLRGRDQEGHPVAPLELFDLSGNFSDLLALDRLACAVHILNFFKDETNTTWLFVNMNPQVFIESFTRDGFFLELMRSKSFPANRVVIEILDESVVDELHLEEAAAECRNLGCMIAIDDFGTGHSNIERLWRLKPDIVKLDQFLTAQAVHDEKVRRMLPGILTTLHEAGAKALMAGVETQDEAMVAIELNFDLVQGFYFALPCPELVVESAASKQFAKLKQDHGQAAALVHLAKRA
jgi:EAL domain-containing protein (putative c-di-GMP-specific phosphodiesterase class I)